MLPCIILILLLFGGSIALGVRWKINIGPVTMAIALVIGCLFMDLTLDDILQEIPLKVIFYIVSVTLFYGIAQENGTLGRLSCHVMYAMRSVPRLLPTCMFLLTAIIAYMGVGIFAGAFLAPLAFEMGSKTKVNPLLTYTCVNCGAILGSNMPQSLGGLVIQGLIAQGPYGEHATAYTWSGSILTAVICIIMVLLSHLLYRSEAPGPECFPTPAPFTAIHKKNLVLIAIISLCIVLGPLALKLCPLAIQQRLTVLTDIGVLCSLGPLAAILLRLGDEREVMRRHVPWCTVVLLSGVSAILGIATKTQALDALAQQLIFIPPVLAAPILACMAGLMSLFTSGVTVVCPTLFPLVPVFSSALGVSPALLYAGIFAGASVTGTSPFSAAGSIVLSSYGSPMDQNRLTYRILAIPMWLLLITVSITLPVTILM